MKHIDFIQMPEKVLITARIICSLRYVFVFRLFVMNIVYDLPLLFCISTCNDFMTSTLIIPGMLPGRVVHEGKPEGAPREGQRARHVEGRSPPVRRDDHAAQGQRE